MLSRSIEVTILKEAVLEREPLLLSLSPLLIVKVDVGALQGEIVKYLHRTTSSNAHLFIFIIDDLRFFMPLEPHHVLGVEPPALLLESFGSKVLRLGALHVVEDEEKRLCA